MKATTIAILGFLPFAAKAEIARSAEWYANHPQQRFEINTACKNWPGEAHHNANCENAFQGGVIADTRNMQAMLGRNSAGASNIGGPSLAYWRDPRNAENRAYWAGQCRAAANRGATVETMQGMWCPAIMATGGY